MGAVPGLISVEHYSTTVPDLDEAVAFFEEVFAARTIRRTGFYSGSASMRTHYNAHPDARLRAATMDVLGMVVELWEYEAPDLRRDPPRNCDAGGHHLGFVVEDVEEAARHLRGVVGVEVLGEPTYLERDNGRRRGWVYFLTPWGTQMELADERSSSTCTAKDLG